MKVTIQVRPEATAQMEINVPSYWHFGSVVTVAMIKVISEKEYIIVQHDEIRLSNSNLDIYLGDGSYQECEPSKFYEWFAKTNQKIVVKSGIELLPLQHELTDEDLAQLRYDEGRELINEERAQHEEFARDNYSHDPNY